MNLRLYNLIFRMSRSVQTSIFFMLLLSPAILQAQSTKVLINFNKYSPQGGLWNDFSSDPVAGLSLTNVHNDQEQPTGISITLQTTWAGAQNSGLNTGNDSGVYPDDVIKNYYRVYQDTEIVLISGLDPLATYNFRFHSGRASNLNPFIEFEINGNTVIADARYNISTLVELVNITPNPNGEVTLYVRNAPGSVQGYLNGMEIEAVAGQVDDAKEIAALRDLYEQTNGQNWTNSTGWPASQAEWAAITNVNQLEDCFGITINNGDVTVVNLEVNNLTDNLPNSIGDLKALTRLDLYKNKITGSIPETLTDLTELTYLYLGRNELSGTIPDDIGNLQKLTFLALFANEELSGGIPESLFTITGLRHLYLFDTDLGGELPDTWDMLPNLVDLWLYRTGFEGALPSSLGSLNNLQNMYLFSNDWIGPIPSSFQNLTSAKNIWLHFSRLNGEIPKWFGDLPALVTLALGHTELTGTIPDEYHKLINLTGLYLEQLDMDGEIPDSWASLTKLKVLDLKFTNLSGQIPEWFITLENLEELRLNDAQFTSLPSFLDHPNKSNLKIHVENNLLDFSSIERNIPADQAQVFNTFTYAPQTTLTEEITVSASAGTVFENDRSGGQYTHYQWQQAVGSSWANIAGAITEDFTLSEPDKSFAGRRYRCEMTNDLAPDLTLRSSTFEIGTVTSLPGFYSTANGDWNDPNIWAIQPGGTPAATPPGTGDAVFIDGHTITITGPISCNEIYITNEAAPAQLIIDGSTLTVDGEIILEKKDPWSKASMEVVNNGQLVTRNE